MGFNYKAAGFPSVKDFVLAMYESEGMHLMAFCEFVNNTSFAGESLANYLKRKDWAMFAKGYNGAGYAENQYDVRLAESYRKFQVG